MAITDSVPGMERGETTRNIIIALVYLLLWPFILTIYVPFAVATNRHDWGDKLANSPLGRFPPIRNGGWQAGITVFITIVVLVGAFAAFGSAGNGDTSGVPTDDQSPTPTMTPESTPTDTPSTTPTETPTDSPTPTPTETPSQGIDQIADERYETSGLLTGVSDSGDVALFGFDDGNLMIFDDDRDGEVIPLGASLGVSHIEINEDAGTAAVAWMSDNSYGLLDLADGDGPTIRHPGLWDIDMAADGHTIVSVSYPIEGSGSVGLSDDGNVEWETDLEDAAGESVAISDDGEHIAVGAIRYADSGGEQQGTPGVRFFDSDGNEQWTHETQEGVISVNINADRQLVVAGTDDGRTVVLDFEGEVLWETEDFGGWVFLSDDGSTLVTSEPNEVIAVDVETGDERWTSNPGFWASDQVSVSDDGSRVLVAEMAAGNLAVIESGEVIWERSTDVGPATGSLSGDGSTWSVIIQNNIDESAEIEIYRDS